MSVDLLIQREKICRYENSYLTKAMKILGGCILVFHGGGPFVSQSVGTIVTMASLTRVDTCQNPLGSSDSMRNKLFLYLDFIPFHSEYSPKWQWGRDSRPQTQLEEEENIFLFITLPHTYLFLIRTQVITLSGTSAARKQSEINIWSVKELQYFEWKHFMY